jgi:PAS domain S-box-containing protein
VPDILFSASTHEKSQRLSGNIMLQRTLDLDWSATDLGPIDSWPVSLKNSARLVLTASTPLALLAGASGTLIYNDATRTIFADIGADGLGRSILDVLPHAADFYRETIALCASGEAPSFQERILKVDRNGGSETAWFDLHFTPVIEGDGTHSAVLVHAFETTDKVRARRALERSEERLQMALDSSGMIGIWDVDLATGLVTVDDRLIKLFGIEGAQGSAGTPLTTFTDRIDSHDRDRVTREIDTAIRTGVDFCSQYQVSDDTGKARSVLASGRVIKDASGTPVRFSGVAVEVTAQVEANTALAESEARFRTLAETVPQIIWSSDCDGRHDYFNSKWYDFTGLNLGGHDAYAWTDLVHPDDRERVFDAWNNSRQTGKPYEIEYRFRHHSGTYRWLLVMALPQRDANGRISRWFGTSTDIHEGKLIAVEREIIAHELHHRIKNMFSVFGALVNLSLRSARDINSYAADLTGRIAALSKAHDFVRPTSGLLPAQTLHVLVQNLLRPYAGTQPSRLSCEGEDIPLCEGAATSFALVFHELATNAAKYGALSVPAGHVRLKTRLDGGRLKATWTETGTTGADGPPAGGGFGSKLLALMVEGQMHGKLERHWEADGLRVEIDVPALSIASAPTKPSGLGLYEGPSGTLVAKSGRERAT